jgi:hypothetical protein
VNHTHGKSAAARSSASLFIDQVAKVSGHNLVYYQGSCADLRNNRQITRSWFWSKDLNVEPQTVKPKDNDMLALVDVDYYVNMPAFTGRHFKPLLLYCFQPDSVAKETGEYKYTFTAKNEVEYHVTGGAMYRHGVWNYTGDSFTSTSKVFGIPWTFSTFSLERRKVDDDHQIILIAPLQKFTGVAAWMARRKFGHTPLRRLKVADGGFLRMQTNHESGLVVHTAEVGGYSVAKIPVSVDDAIFSTARTCKKELSYPIVKSKMPADTEGGEILLEYHLENALRNPIHRINLVQDSVYSYQWVETLTQYDPDAKKAICSFMDPLVSGAFAPDMTKMNEKRSVEKRVTGVFDKTALTPFLIRVVDEFVSEVSRGCEHSLEPLEEIDVYERQKKPSQRSILIRAEHDKGDTNVSSFMKREAGQNINDPRNISTINGAIKRDYSMFMYSLADFIKTYDWYAFGKPPRKLAERVVEIALSADMHLDATDFSRMDGRIGPVARYLEEQICYRLFRQEYWVRLIELMRTQRHCSGVTTHGVRYDSGLSRLSGSPETSIFNTLLNTFTAFLALRMTRSINGYLTPKESWKRLGVYAGDDGLTADVREAVYRKAAEMVGQVLTKERTEKGAMGVTFLARHYGPYVWFGDSNTCCNFQRVLSKFHTTVHLPSNITITDKLVDKTLALATTDNNSPVITDFVKKVRQLYPKRTFKNVCGAWNIHEESSNQYPNVYDDWMDQLFHEQIPSFNLSEFEIWIGNANCSTIFRPPRLAQPTTPVVKDGTVVVSDHLIITDITVATPTPPVQPARKRSRPRKKKANRPSRLIVNPEPSLPKNKTPSPIRRHVKKKGSSRESEIKRRERLD